MPPDFPHDLIPRADADHLIGALKAMKDQLHGAAQQWELLDESGHLPAEPSYTALLQHAIDAQDLSREVLGLATGFARGPHRTTTVGSTVMKHLATAVTVSNHAAAHFAETAEGALALLRSPEPADRHVLANRMVIDHATARAYLRRASESLHNAAEELRGHLGFQHFLTTLTRQKGSPAPPPPKPSGRHR
ncbi:hypothetical protein ACFH04_13580 [Streptomyces noboritoensis]|uniref:Uncharacterized protein n=1 Tax=Streptomyces noboritoensis TaxID=67337 RepID=A0ABV6TJQ7_9ACTN